MLRIKKYCKWRNHCREDRPKVFVGETASEGEDGARNHAASNIETCLRGQAFQLFWRFKLRLHHFGIVSTKIPDGTPQEA